MHPLFSLLNSNFLVVFFKSFFFQKIVHFLLISQFYYKAESSKLHPLLMFQPVVDHIKGNGSENN